MSVLDKTVTAGGARLMKKWIKEPLLTEDIIAKRLDAVDALHKNVITREEIISLLQDTYDLERLISTINYGNVNPRYLLSLHRSLLQVPPLKEKINILSGELLNQISSMHDLQETADLIGKAVKEDAPITIREAGNNQAGV